MYTYLVYSFKAILIVLFKSYDHSPSYNKSLTIGRGYYLCSFST